MCAVSQWAISILQISLKRLKTSMFCCRVSWSFLNWIVYSPCFLQFNFECINNMKTLCFFANAFCSKINGGENKALRVGVELNFESCREEHSENIWGVTWKLHWKLHWTSFSFWIKGDERFAKADSCSTHPFKSNQPEKYPQKQSFGASCTSMSVR